MLEPTWLRRVSLQQQHFKHTPEVITETHQDDYTDVATLVFILVFIFMMTLDVSLG